MTDLQIARKLVNISNSAKDRGIEFDLSFKKLKKLLKQKTCYFTGVEFAEEEESSNYRTIDRLDNSKGYVDSNIVACISRFNKIKGSMSLEEIEQLYKGVKHLIK